MGVTRGAEKPVPFEELFLTVSPGGLSGGDWGGGTGGEVKGEIDGGVGGWSGGESSGGAGGGSRGEFSLGCGGAAAETLREGAAGGFIGEAARLFVEVLFIGSGDRPVPDGGLMLPVEASGGGSALGGIVVG